ncbi:MAG: nucleotidyltransferase domain-containing protein [Cyanobium sp. CZS 48M]|nr:nucleotidyltransferase domain-containing protein [Cyanobium sp. CZS48M]
MCGSFHCKQAVPGLPAEASDRLLTLLGRDPGVEQVWLYGSRAMGRHRPASDIDLTLKGPALSHEGLLQLMAAVDDLLLLERVPSAPEAMPR